MKILIITLIVYLAITGTTYASYEDTSIQKISSDGAVIFLDDGSTWEVDAVDRVDSALWLEADDVLACDDGYLVHKDDGEKVDATQLK